MIEIGMLRKICKFMFALRSNYSGFALVVANWICKGSNEEAKMQEVVAGAEKQHVWYMDVQKRMSDFLQKFTSASESAMNEQPVVNRMSVMQVRYSKQHEKDMSALERRQRKTIELSSARVKALRLAKSHSHVEESGSHWQAYDGYINPDA